MLCLTANINLSEYLGHFEIHDCLNYLFSKTRVFCKVSIADQPLKLIFLNIICLLVCNIWNLRKCCLEKRLIIKIFWKYITANRETPQHFWGACKATAKWWNYRIRYLLCFHEKDHIFRQTLNSNLRVCEVGKTSRPRLIKSMIKGGWYL